jgi:hypothetical protein
MSQDVARQIVAIMDSRSAQEAADMTAGTSLEDTAAVGGELWR